ncbi:MAG TPA: YceI family protein [Ktedonobacterales bacterium]|nr:YceI family protein [Ktedonobacterales bacterium]
MRGTLKRPRAIAVGLAAIAAVVIVVAIVASIYIFGAGGGKTGAASGTVTVPTLAPTDGATLFTIDSSSSKATFTIDEVLFGNPNTVVGETDKVAGQILINAQDPSKSQVGEVKIDVSTLVTDNDLRNRTLQGRILQTDTPANQYATFVAKSISGLPESIAVGQQVSFKITGDLTIHQMTKTVTFDVTVTAVSDKQITGTASTTVKYSDFGISVPDVPSVTGLGDTVKLALAFTANAG